MKVETRKPTRLAYIEHVGGYDRIPFQKYFERLYGWAKEKHIRPGFYPLGIYLDSPYETPPSKLRSEIGIPIYNKAKPEGEIKIKEMPAMKVAAISHKGPSANYPETYKTLNDWIAENGYEWSGPSIEIYTRKPTVVGGETILHAKVEAPIRKK